MAGNVNLTFDLKYLENGASDEKSMTAFLCSSSRGIQRSLFQVATTDTFCVMVENVDLTFDLELLDRKSNSRTRHMGRKPFTSCTFWSLFGVNRPSSFRDMAGRPVKVFDLLTSGDLDL